MSVIEKLARQFESTAREHHQAFAHTNGADPNWPLWYAENLQPALARLLDVELATSEIIALLKSLDRVHRARGANTPWPQLYAELTAQRFVQDSSVA